MTKQSLLDVNEEWTEDVHTSKYSTLKFKYRVTCDPHYYGKGCENLCRPRDDQFGHYSCSPTGQIVCLAGWQGDYCTKRKYYCHILPNRTYIITIVILNNDPCKNA